MIARNLTFEEVCRQLMDAFFGRYPNPSLKAEASRALRALIARGIPTPGKPGGWAAGIVYALATRGRRACGVPDVLNGELERAFGVTMSTVYKRAWAVKRLLRP